MSKSKYRKYVLFPFNKEGLRRIKYKIDIPRYGIKAGDLGGYLEGYHNLSQEGDCCVLDNAVVFEYAQVYDSAGVSGSATVCGFARVSDNAHIYGNAQISMKMHICGNTQVY